MLLVLVSQLKVYLFHQARTNFVSLLFFSACVEWPT